ncbi:MAG: 50S ribosomal protein L11 methyltransferase [Zetaproteobacteria bacterium]|nr:MAG: 50S ribosomal protein L11 methyltransferase [Zetaproteobacteria bacterium]
MQAPKHLELRLSATAMDEDAFEQWCASMHAIATAEEIDADSGQAQRLAWFDATEHTAASLARSLKTRGIASDAIELRMLAEQDWATAWQRDWQGMPIGERLWVRPSFREPAPADKIDIVLDPGMAFGTGTHPTTRLCLRAIEQCCTQGKVDTLLDMGAGSGILAIAACKLGVRRATAVDLAEEAVLACRENARINGVELEALLTDHPPKARFDLVVANILAQPLIEMAASLAACAQETLILSGLLVEQCEGVRQAYARQGLTLVRQEAEGQWGMLVMRR